MTTPLITVLITSYNYGQFIEQAIDSVLSQEFTLDQLQIIIVDDGSVDDTFERVKKYSSRVEYFYKPNGGQASSLNFGLGKARGEIVVLLDADDFCLPGRLARVAEAFEKDPALGMVYHRLQEWHVRTGERRETDFLALSGNAREIPNFYLRYIPMATSAISYRRTFLIPLLPIPDGIRMLADAFFLFLVPILAPILAIPELLSVYRVHGNNCYYADDLQMPTDMRRSRVERWKILMAAIREWLDARAYSRKLRPVQQLLERWTLYIETEEFSIQSPGRLRFFSHLVRYNRCFKPQIPMRLRIINYINAFGALLTGYKHFYLLEKWRLDLTSWIQRVFEWPTSGSA